MKTTKFFATAISAGILTFSLTSPSLVFAQSVTPLPKSHDARLQTNQVKFEEDVFYSLDELFASTDLSVEEQERITQDILKIIETDGRTMDRTVMRTVIKRLSHSEVQSIVNSSDPIGDLMGYLPYVGGIYSVLRSFSQETFRTAARNGWGLEYVVVADRDNPTSTGIYFYWRYVK